MDELDKIISDILNGKRDLPQFNQPEHAGVCTAGPLLVGALLVCYNARESFTAGCNAAESKRAAINWQIDEEQERQLQQWAEAKNVWFPHSEEWITSTFGPMIAKGAEAKVFYRTGDTSVINCVLQYMPYSNVL